MGFEMKKDEEKKKKDRAALLLERRKIAYNFVLLLTTFFVVLIGVLTLAWFVSNKKVKSTSMNVMVRVPEGIQISPGHLEGGYLSVTNGAVNVPIVSADWNDEGLEIDKYYRFGRLFPASSDTGVPIIFTPDSTDMGKALGETPRFYVADGRSDGALKHSLDSNVAAAGDEDSLMATAHVLSASDSETDEEQVTFWDGYAAGAFWFDTNDDGYYAEFPAWLRTNSPVSVSLCVEGYVTKWNGETDADEEDADGDGEVSEPDRLYKAVRIAVLREREGENGTVLEPAVSTGNSPVSGSILPLKNAGSFEEGRLAVDVLDSRLLTDRDADHFVAGELYGLRPASHEVVNDEKVQLETEPVYQNYVSYGADIPIVILDGHNGNGEFGPAEKLIFRVWLDGDDKDCWNATAGQDWCINLRFYEMTAE
ncbi:MAG: hypothetical protein K6F51_14450 [Acetatifactor sp.]|nr:hypothetical protein [Acetatifactor sp.]